jgi:hypothetical protein
MSTHCTSVFGPFQRYSRQRLPFNVLLYVSQYSGRTVSVNFGCIQAPLLLGCDVRNMTKETMDIIANKEVIAVNQGNHIVLCIYMFILHVHVCMNEILSSLNGGSS